MFLKRKSDTLKILSALLLAVQQSLGRFILWASVHGVELPWLEWSERAVLPSTLERYRRRAMISQLRTQRYRIRRGPYFLRSRLEKLSELYRLIQFPALLSAKVFVALLICSAPFFVFFVVRIYLPVEQRIAVTKSAFDKSLFATAMAVRPMVSVVEAFVTEGNTANGLSETHDEVRNSEARSDNSAEVKLLQGQGSAHAELRQGWIIDSTMEKMFQFGRFGESLNLRFRYRPIPTDESQLECKFQVTRANGDILYVGTFNASALSRQALVKSPLTRGLQEKLLPELARNRVTTASHRVSVGLAAGESALKIRIDPLNKGVEGTCQALIYGFEVSGSRRIEKAVSDLRSLLLISFDALHADLALNDSLMPWLTGFFTSPRTIHFAQHHALDVRKGESMRTLLGLPEERDTQTEQTKQPSILGKLRQNGYRVVLVGNFKRLDGLINEVDPDVVVRVENETYEPSLVLAELNALLEEEGSTPLLVVVRLSGMSGPKRPFASDISLRTATFQGNLRSTSDSLIRSHLKTLDRVLAKNFSKLESQGLFEKMDIALTAERGFDLGLNQTARDSFPTRSPELVLNQETMRVPLGVSLAKPSERELHHLLKTQYYLTTHHDLARTLWENMGVFDAKFAPNTVRLWKKDDLHSSPRSSLRFSARKTEDEIRKLAIKSKIQEGVIFSDPSSAGGFLKYVSQANPTRVSIPKASGWQGSVAVDVDAGERFFQVSQRGRREEVVNRVNSQFLREARRILRQERKLPLRFRFAANAMQQIHLTLEERSSKSFSPLKVNLPKGLMLKTVQLSQDLAEHHITGVAQAGDLFELRGSGGLFRLIANEGDGLLVACSEALHFTAEALNDALIQKVLCLLDAPTSERIDSFKVLNKKTLSFWLAEDEQQTCSNEQQTPDFSADESDCKSFADAAATRF
ncbi:MAG: hypothetical protein RJB13_839 [Pseudomonadota bacterium]